MSRISIKINLAQLKHALMTTPKGAEVIVIPIKDNHLFKSEKGNIYLDLVAWELKNKKEDVKDTHIVKQSFSKDALAEMPEDQKQNLPILGNATLIIEGREEPEPNNAGGSEVANGIDDLPF